MRWAPALALLVAPALLVAMARTEAQAQTSLFTNVSPSFRPGPYSFLRVDPKDPEHFVVAGGEGWVAETRDAGQTVSESQALVPRVYFPMVLRGKGGNRGGQFGRSLGRAAHRLFISMLSSGAQTTRWAPWMALEDPSTEILDVAMPQPGGHGALAGPNGVFISDERMGVWHRALGSPRPKGNLLVGLSVAFDPSNADLLFAGTNDGFWVSTNGGQSFNRHPDKSLKEEAVKQIIWDAKDPNNILLVAGETVFKSENHGDSFEAVLSAGKQDNKPSDVNAVVTAEEGVYVATQRGLSLYGGEGTKEIIKDENVVGVVPVGTGSVLAATELALFLIDGEGKRTLMNTTAADPFVKLAGTAELGWALTKYGIFRIGAKEPREKKRARRGPQMLMSIDEVQNATIAHLGVGDPSKSRLHDRWYAAFMPLISVEVLGGRYRSNDLRFDATYPISYRYANATNAGGCCGTPSVWNPMVGPDVQPVVFAKWDLARIIAGPYGAVSMPNGLVESGLRGFRVKILEEVRWRYREIRNLCAQLRYPPTDPKVLFMWRTRLEEYANYIEAISGKQVVAVEHMEDEHEVED